MNWLGTQVEWLKSFFSEFDGKASIKRFIMLMVVLSFLQAYVKTTLDTKIIVDIPQNWMFLIGGIIGLGILDKWVTFKSKGTNGQNP